MPCELGGEEEMRRAAALQRARRWRVVLCDAVCHVYVMELVRCYASLTRRCRDARCAADGVKGVVVGDPTPAGVEQVSFVSHRRIMREAQHVLKQTRHDRPEAVVLDHVNPSRRANQ